MNIPGVLLSSTRHDNVDVQDVAGLNQKVRVAVRWLNRENNQVSSVNTLSNNIFDRASKRGVPDIKS